MNTKVTRGSNQLLTNHAANGGLKLAAVALCALLTVCGLTLPVRSHAQQGAAPAKAPLTESAAPLTEKRISEDFNKALELVRANYVEPKETDVLTKSAIQGMLHQLDPHSDYMDAKSFKEFNDKQHSRYYGIGALISSRRTNIKQYGTYVFQPFEGSPAYRAGLKYGDQIVAVDGKDTSNLESGKVRELLIGERGTQLRVTVSRPGVNGAQTFILVRDQIPRPSIPNSYMVKPGIGYIGLTENFQSTTTMELVQAIADLKEKGATQFILDLRGNGGGYLDQGIRVSDKLLQRGQAILAVKHRNPALDQNWIAEMGSSDNFPLVVLVNGGSASASEIVAGAVQDNDRGLIVGETTFGKGLVQRLMNVGAGAGLVLTIGRYYTPSGRIVQRDYSSGSLVDYYTKRNFNANDKKGDTKYTLTGRPVFSGMGIEPDVKLENADTIALAPRSLWDASFLFVRDLVNGQVAGATQFKLERGPDYTSKLKGSEYVVSDDIVKAWGDYMLKFGAANPEFRITPAIVDEGKLWARKFIREGVLLAAFGEPRAKQLMAELDLQLQRGIQELPNAAALNEKARSRSNAMIRR